MSGLSISAGCLALGLLAAAGAGAEEAADEANLTGAVSRPELEAAEPDWVELAAAAAVDRGSAASLATVPGGARVTVYLGTWCSDSRREVTRFWRALDEAGAPLPFAVEYVAVDRDKADPGGRASAARVLYVPTFVVERQGREVGRIVEESPRSIETDLAALLFGEASGVLSGSRRELAAAGEETPER